MWPPQSLSEASAALESPSVSPEGQENVQRTQMRRSETFQRCMCCIVLGPSGTPEGHPTGKRIFPAISGGEKPATPRPPLPRLQVGRDTPKLPPHSNDYRFRVGRKPPAIQMPGQEDRGEPTEFRQRSVIGSPGRGILQQSAGIPQKPSKKFSMSLQTVHQKFFKASGPPKNLPKWSPKRFQMLSPRK